MNLSVDGLVKDVQADIGHQGELNLNFRASSKLFAGASKYSNCSSLLSERRGLFISAVAVALCEPE